MNDRGVASPVGVVLILGMSLAAIVAMLAVGATVLDDARNDAEISQMENSMSQFSSKASLVGLGESSHQRFALGRAAGGEVAVREDAGRVSIFDVPAGDNWTDIDPMYNESYGAVVYRNGDTEVAYQGGGVWRRFGDSSRMVSPPEYHYHSRTLTFPIIRVAGDGAASGRLQGAVSSGAVDQPIYPHPDYSNRTNPLEDGTVYVKIESDYCGGWESFFEDRSDGGLEQRCDEGDERTVVADLTVPFEESFSNGIIATDQVVPRGGAALDGGQYEEGSNRPSASPEIEAEIENCVDNGCDDLDETLDSEIDNGTYYADSDVEFDNATFDTTNGSIDLVIDGDLDVHDTNEIDGDGEVRIFLTGDFDLRGSINEGGSANQLQVYVHSDAEEVTLGGNTHITGIIYAPNADVEKQGTGTVTGAIVGETIELRGDPSSEIEYDESLEDFQTDLGTGQTPITYLHVTENTVEVEL